MFQLAARTVAEAQPHDLRRSCGASFRIPTLPGVLFDNMPNHFLGHFRAPRRSFPADATEQPSTWVMSAALSQSSIVSFTHVGTGTVRTMSWLCLSNRLWLQCSLATLKMINRQLRLVPAAADRNPRAPQESHDPACPLDWSDWAIARGYGLKFSAVNQFPSRHPEFFLRLLHVESLLPDRGSASQNRRLHTPAAVPQSASR